jgi:hypothetical protein
VQEMQVSSFFERKGAQQCEMGISPILYLTAAFTSLYLRRKELLV